MTAITLRQVEKALSSGESEDHIYIDTPNVTIGIPLDGTSFFDRKTGKMNYADSFLAATESPYIFRIAELNLSLTHGQITTLSRFENIIAIVCHGIRYSNNWYFSDGQDVEETVLEYNRMAQMMSFPLIEFITACNRYEGSGSTESTNTQRLKAEGIVYPKQDTITITSEMKSNGLHLTTESLSPFINLDRLAQKQI